MTFARSVGNIRRGNVARKFGNIPTVVDGIEFHSKREAKRWGVLRLLEKGGAIRMLERQVKFPLDVNGHRITTYTADFVYHEQTKDGHWRRVVEDVKGYANDRWPMKKKLMFAIHGVEVLES